MFHRGLLHGHRRLKKSRVKWSAVSALEPRRVDNRAFLIRSRLVRIQAWLLVRGRASVVATCYFLRSIGGIVLRSLSKKEDRFNLSPRPLMWGGFEWLPFCRL